MQYIDYNDYISPTYILISFNCNSVPGLNTILLSPRPVRFSRLNLVLSQYVLSFILFSHDQKFYFPRVGILSLFPRRLFIGFANDIGYSHASCPGTKKIPGK